MSDNIIRADPDPTIEPDPRGLGPLFFEKIKEHGDKISQIDSATGETQTYNELLLNSIRVAQQIQAKGITSDDIITLCVPNIIDACLPFLAALYLKIRVSSLDPTLPYEDCLHLLKIVKPKIVFCGEESVKMIESALKNAGITSELVIFGDTKEHTPFSDFLVSSGTEDLFVAEPVDDINETAVIFFSSGTTGLPKGICTTHYGLHAVQLIMLQGHNYKMSLYFTTLYWISSVMVLIVAILSGGTRILCRKFDPELTLQLIEKYKVTFTLLSPFFVYNFIQNPNILKYDISSINTVIVGGGTIGKDQLSCIRKCFSHAVVFFGYGMTENHGVVVYFNPTSEKHLIYSKVNSVGRKLPGYSYKIVDTETNENLGPNKAGEIRIKGKCLMSGYYNNPEESAKAWDEDGFLHTGDVGYYDEDECFYVIDRVKDVLKYQSWHITPAELENVLRTHPDVKEAAVIGKPHPKDGEQAMGVIVLKSGAKSSELEILNFFNAKFSERKQLHGGVKFVKSLPYTPTGKLRRRELRDNLLQNANQI